MTATALRSRFRKYLRREMNRGASETLRARIALLGDEDIVTLLCRKAAKAPDELTEYVALQMLLRALDKTLDMR